jgi:hypothetical protein
VNAFGFSLASLTDERRIRSRWTERVIAINGTRKDDRREPMNTKMARLEQVDRWLNLVDELPLGHPDRLKFLAYAEEIIAGAVPEEEAGAPAQMNRPRSVVVPQGRSKT